MNRTWNVDWLFVRQAGTGAPAIAFEQEAIDRQEAEGVARRLCKLGWRADAERLDPGRYVVEVRMPAGTRGQLPPRVLRTSAECRALLERATDRAQGQAAVLAWLADGRLVTA